MPGWTEHAEHHAKLLTEQESVEPQPPSRCGTCGRSMWLADHNDDGLCDECWEKRKQLSFDEQTQREYDRIKRGLPFS